MGVGATNVSLERGGASGVPDARALCLGSEKGGMHIESTTYKRCTRKLDLLWPAVTARQGSCGCVGQYFSWQGWVLPTSDISL